MRVFAGMILLLDYIDILMDKTDPANVINTLVMENVSNWRKTALVSQ